MTAKSLGVTHQHWVLGVIVCSLIMTCCSQYSHGLVECVDLVDSNPRPHQETVDTSACGIYLHIH